MIKKTSGIYKITNTLTNEAYIGQSKNIEKRIATHKEDLENGTHVNKGLQEDYDIAKSLDSDYEIFTFEIIKEVKPKDLNKEEMYWINEFNSFERGYNKTSGGIHDETKGHVDYGGGRLFTDEKRIKLMTKELTDDFANKENYIFKTTSNEVFCSKCGKEFNDEFDFCPFCGTEKPKPKICPKCKLEPSIEFSFCPKCGIELIDKEEYLKYEEEKRLKKIKEEEEKRLRKIEEEEEKIRIFIKNGECYFNSYEFKKALEQYKYGKEICDSLNENLSDIMLLVTCINQIDIINKALKYEHSLENYKLHKKNDIDADTDIEDIFNKYLEEFSFFENLNQRKISKDRIMVILKYIDHIVPKYDSIIFWHKINILKYLERDKEILQLYNMALQWVPDTNPSLECKIWYSKAKFLEEIRRYIEAIHIYDHLIKKFNHNNCLIDRANCLRKLGKIEEAKMCEFKHNHNKKIRKRAEFIDGPIMKMKKCPICDKKQSVGRRQCIYCYYSFYKIKL